MSGANAVPRIPRVLTLEKLVQVIHSIFEAKFQAKLSSTSDSNTRSNFLERFFYSYLENVYSVKAVVIHVAHDLLTSLREHYEADAAVRLCFGLMSGDIDDSMWMYFMQCKCIISLVPISNRTQFDKFITSLYPGATVTDIDHILRKYHSYHKQYSKKSIIDYLLNSILSGREIRMQKWLRILKMKDPEGSGHLEQEAFEDVALSISPQVSRRDAAKIFMYTAEHRESSVLPVADLASMATVIEASLVLKAAKAEYNALAG